MRGPGARPIPDPASRRKAWYIGLHAAIGDLYGNDPAALADKDGDAPGIPLEDFLKAVKRVFREKGYRPELLAGKEPLKLVNDTYQAYRQAARTGIAGNEIPEAMARKLDHDAFMFSGFKVHHELSEAGLSLRDEAGNLKSYERFERDVLKIHNTYNRSWLKSEYQFAVASAQMAARWQDIEAKKDRYHLQYRTAGDDRVREEHAALHGITLPPDDPFWASYFPPNGWRCRCTAVQVNKGKYPLSDSREAVRKGEKATIRLDRFGNNKAAIFRFNPGIDERLFPPKHPYLPKGCGDCNRGIRNLAYNPDNPMCQACTVIATCADKELVRITSKEWIADAIRKASDGKPCKRAITVAPVPEKMLDFCEKNKIDLAPGGLQVTDDGIMHALRPNKKARGAAISTEQMENMAEILEKADIYYDSADDKRNFVFVAEDKGKILKYVFNPNYTARADGKKEKRNLFVTAGIIQVYNINWTKIE